MKSNIRSVHPQTQVNIADERKNSSDIVDQQSHLHDEDHDVMNELDYQKLRTLWEFQDNNGVKQYQPLRVPPYKRFYDQHQQASKLHDQSKVVDQTQRCTCCNQPINPGRFKIKCYYQRARHLRDSSKTTYEYSKAFKIILKISIPLAIFSFLMSLINFATNDQSDYQIVALGNVFSSLFHSIFCIVLYFIWNRTRTIIFHKLRKNQLERDDPKSYAVIVKGLKSQFFKNQLIEHFNVNFPDCKIHRIDYTYNLQQLLTIIKKMKSVDRQRRVELPMKRQPFLCFKPLFYPSQSEINSKSKQFLNKIEPFQDVKYDEDFSKKLERLGIAIVTFEKKEDAELIANKCQRSLFDYFCRPHYLRLGKNKITIKSAPGPQEIIWQNLNVKFSIGRFLLLWGVTGIFLAISGLGNWGISRLKSSFALSLFSSILLVLMNKMIKLIMFALSKEQKHHTQTEFEVSLMFRYLLATFVNTALVPFFIHIRPSTYFVQGGLISQILTVFIALTFIDPLLSFIDVRFAFKYFHKRYIRNQGPDCNLTQQQAQQIFAGVQPRMAEKYADFLLTYLLMMFYLPIFPIGGLMATLGLWLLHYIQMYMFLRHFGRPKFLSDGLIRATILVIFIGIALYLFTNIYFHSQISSASLISSFITFFVLLIIALILWCVVKHYKLNSTNRFNKCWQFIFKYVYVDMENKSVIRDGQDGVETAICYYSDQHYIRKDYSSHNPATQRKSKIKQLQFRTQDQNANWMEKEEAQDQIKKLKEMKYSDYILTNYLHQKEDQDARDALNKLTRKTVRKVRKDQQEKYVQEDKVNKEQEWQNSYSQISKNEIRLSTKEQQSRDEITGQNQTTKAQIQSDILKNAKNIQKGINPFAKKPLLDSGNDFNQSMKKGSANLPPLSSSNYNSENSQKMKNRYIPPPPPIPRQDDNYEDDSFEGGEDRIQIISDKIEQL